MTDYKDATYAGLGFSRQLFKAMSYGLNVLKLFKAMSYGLNVLKLFKAMSYGLNVLKLFKAMSYGLNVTATAKVYGNKKVTITSLQTQVKA